MKKLFIATTLLAGLLVSMAGCKKNEIKYGDFDVVDASKAMLKINVVSPYRSNPTMNLSIDSERVSNPITSRTPFPGGGYNTGGGSTADYLALTPGEHEFKLAIPNVGKGTDSIVLYKTKFTIEGGVYQSLQVADTSANTTSFVLSDNRAMPDSGFVRYRFVNLMPNVESLDLYFGTTKLASAIPYKGSIEFTMALPAASAAWTTKVAGTSTTLATYTSTSSYTNRRVYTVFASGYSGLTSPDTRRAYVSFYLMW